MSLLFRVRTRLCALPLAHVLETMRPLPIEPMAGASPSLRGLAIIRGAPVPVVDVACLLGDDSTPADVEALTPASARFVMTRIADRGIALAVDAVVGVRFIDGDSFREMPPLLRDADVDVVDAIGTLDAELLLVLRSARLVPSSLRGGESAS